MSCCVVSYTFSICSWVGACLWKTCKSHRLPGFGEAQSGACVDIRQKHRTYHVGTREPRGRITNTGPWVCIRGTYSATPCINSSMIAKNMMHQYPVRLPYGISGAQVRYITSSITPHPIFERCNWFTDMRKQASCHYDHQILLLSQGVPKRIAVQHPTVAFTGFMSLHLWWSPGHTKCCAWFWQNRYWNTSGTSSLALHMEWGM